MLNICPGTYEVQTGWYFWFITAKIEVGTVESKTIQVKLKLSNTLTSIYSLLSRLEWYSS